MVKYASVICFFFIAYVPLLAQDNDTLKAKVKDTTLYYVKATTAGSINKTNDGNTFITNNNVRFNITKKTMKLNTGSSWIYGANPIGMTNNDFVATMDLNLFAPQSKWYYWAIATYDQSFSLKINHRIQTGLGLGYTFINTPETNINLSNGIIYEYNDLYNSVELISPDYQTSRNSLRLKYRFEYKKVIILDGVHFWQQSLSVLDDYIIKSNSNLSVKIRSWLSITSSLVYNKLNVTSKETLFVNYGLTFEKTF